MTHAKKLLFFLFAFFFIMNGLFAQTEFPAGDFWSLDGGMGMSGIMVEGASFQAVIDPKLWLSPPLMVGSKVGINYSAEEDNRNILTFEGQVYLRWNFLRLGTSNKKTNVFIQGGLGLLSAYRGNAEDPSDIFGDVKMTRGSLLADAALGVTIPLSERWHIEPQVRGGYPHLFGASLTAGYKFRLPDKTIYETKETIRVLPSNEIIKRIMISEIEFVIFGPDIGRYNIGIDRDAQQVNELVLNEITRILKNNPNFRVRIEGHANPFTINRSEADELMALSSLRANNVAAELRKRDISDDQMILISFGGTRTATSDFDVRNRNRRVELMIIQIED